MEPGRSMLHANLGRWYVREPARERAPAGSTCGLCGLAGAVLWVMDGNGTRGCIAQYAITSKRAGRKSAGDPEPGPGESGKYSMAEGSFAIAGPHGALLVSRLTPVAPLPPGIEARFGEDGAVRRAIAGLVRSPPRFPFVAAWFGKRANYAMAISTDARRIVVNGPKAFVLDGPEAARAIAAALLLGLRGARDMAAMRERLASGTGTGAQRAADRVAFLAMREAGTMPMAGFRALPAPGSPAWRAAAVAVETGTDVDDDGHGAGGNGEGDRDGEAGDDDGEG